MEAHLESSTPYYCNSQNTIEVSEDPQITDMLEILFNVKIYKVPVRKLYKPQGNLEQLEQSS